MGRRGPSTPSAIPASGNFVTITHRIPRTVIATPLAHALGRTGVMVVTRLLGMLLAALSVQFVIDGLKGSGLFP